MKSKESNNTMRADFEYTSNLQYKVKSLQAQLAGFESGKKYMAMKEEHRLIVAGKDEEIRRLTYELSQANSALITMRENWFLVNEDIEREHKKALSAADKKINKLEERTLKAERIADEMREKLSAKNKELYETKSELEEERGKNQKLTAQINRDYENSSIPSSEKPNHKKIANNREKTDKKPGGQPGHKGHGRKRLVPANIQTIPAPEEFTLNPNYKPTGKTITKQIINLRVLLEVTEYQTPEFRNRLTGRRVHADFPDGVVNDVNYGGSVKALAFLLNNHCFVSIDKTRRFLAELTGGELNISKGMINGLSEEFSLKTLNEQRIAFSDILLSPTMNTDFTSARLNGKNVQVLVCADPRTALYFVRESKGHKGIEGTPICDYQGTLIHDHDRTFYNYGNAHQECLVHILRYLVGSMENEPNLRWNKQMHELIREMIHFRNSIPSDVDLDKNKVCAYEKKYREILVIAKDEYEYEPPSKYYKDGFNLYKRMEKFEDSHLLFLHNKGIPTNNNYAERLLRILKRKMKQVMTFRSFESLTHFCEGLGMLDSLHRKDQSFYAAVSNVFN